MVKENLAAPRKFGYPHARMHAARLQVEPVTRLLRALGDDTRLRILALLAQGELCVCHVQQALSLSQPAASRHLAVLKAAGAIESRRAGSWTWHRLALQPDARRRSLLKTLLRGFPAQDLLRKDVERLVRAKGPAACR